MVYMRRLSDKIIAAHKQACEEAKVEVAEHLLQALVLELSSVSGMRDKRHISEEMVAAFELNEKTKKG